MSSTRIVVLFGSGQRNARSTGLSSEKPLLQQLIESSNGEAIVSIITLGAHETPGGVSAHVALDPADIGVTDRLWRALGAHALRDALSRFPIGRLLNSMGPVDQGRVFWRAVKRSSDALSVIRNSDVAIAADMPAVKTAWIARRRSWVATAHYDHRSAALGTAFTLPVD